ncbi:MAG: beta-lactamase family protein [Chloroflexi bacterium]|nr:beta-lactamase family protein [Chloroflexota bacterium]
MTTALRRTDPDRLRACLSPAASAVEAGTIPSAVVTVADSSGTILTELFPGPSTPRLRGDSIFFLASLTKPVVATAVMRMVERGLVDLHDPIQRLVPAFRGPGKELITAWHVLTHTAGIQDVHPDVLRQQRPSTARLLEMVCQAPLRFEPGSRYEYCSSSFHLLAELLERCTGRPFPEALHELVMEPAGMVDTSFDPRHARPRILPVDGVPMRNRLVRELVLRYLARTALPGGGLWGTEDDLARFGRALLPNVIADGRGLLSAASVAEMTREQTAGIEEISADGTRRDPRYALGWGKPRVDGTAPSVVGGLAPAPEASASGALVAPDDQIVTVAVAATAGGDDVPSASATVPASAATFTHGGAAGARLWVDPERDLVFVFLTNLWGASDAAMFESLAGIYRILDSA